MDIDDRFSATHKCDINVLIKFIKTFSFYEFRYGNLFGGGNFTRHLKLTLAPITAYFSSHFLPQNKRINKTMDAGQSTCAFDKLLGINVPHIVEKIFLSQDYESFKSCLKVSNTWKNLLTSEPFHKKLKSQFYKQILDDEKKLWHASEKGNTEEIKRLLSSNMVNVNHYYVDQSPALNKAVEHGHKEVVQEFLDAGAEINMADWRGRTPLYWAAMLGRKDIVQLLLDREAQTNIADADGWAPLHKSAWKGDKQVVQVLLEAGAELESTNQKGETPLYLAARWGNKNVQELLLERGAKTNQIYRELNKKIAKKGKVLKRKGRQGSNNSNITGPHQISRSK